jgi:hypothetical protein
LREDALSMAGTCHETISKMYRITRLMAGRRAILQVTTARSSAIWLRNFQ